MAVGPSTLEAWIAGAHRARRGPRSSSRSPPCSGNGPRRGRAAITSGSGVRNYLHDFSQLETAPAGHLVLWERYLVYAVALGVSDELAAVSRRGSHPSSAAAFAAWYVSTSHGRPGLRLDRSVLEWLLGQRSELVHTAVERERRGRRLLGWRRGRRGRRRDRRRVSRGTNSRRDRHGAHGPADRGLRADRRHPDRGARRAATARSTGWCVPALRLRCGVRRAARVDREPRSVAPRARRRHPDGRAALPRRHARARDDVPHRRRRRARHRLHADPRPDRRHRARGRGPVGPRPDAHGARRSASTTARSSRGSAGADDRRCAPSPAPTRSSCTRRCTPTAPGKTTVADFVVEAGEKVPFILAYHASHERPPAATSTRRRAIKETAAVVAQVVGAVHLRGRVARRGDALAHHAEGAHVRADRRDRRRADDVAARSGSAASATGTTATAGCATPRSR